VPVTSGITKHRELVGHASIPLIPAGARKAGFDVEKGLWKRMLGYINNRLRIGRPVTYYYNRDQNKKSFPKEVIYGLYVLALAGRPNVSVMELLQIQPCTPNAWTANTCCRLRMRWLATRKSFSGIPAHTICRGGIRGPDGRQLLLGYPRRIHRPGCPCGCGSWKSTDPADGQACSDKLKQRSWFQHAGARLPASSPWVRSPGKTRSQRSPRI